MKRLSPILLPVPAYDSKLTSLLLELQYLRRFELSGTTPPAIFFQLKSFFHLVESLQSTRIEGNRTTLADAVDARVANRASHDESSREISNLEEAIQFIEDAIKPGDSISKGFLLELHKRVVAKLSPAKEGDRAPGQFRKDSVRISGSEHVPPDGAVVLDYVDELIDFINQPVDPKFDLLRVAVAHHRFVWIHPFRNGNGRVVRLLTYAMLIAKGFNVSAGRILNPSNVFCKDRNRYYEMLSLADSGKEVALLEWCEYVLDGVLEALRRIDRLLDYRYLQERILVPTIEIMLETNVINERESKILKVGVTKVPFQASDIHSITSGMISSERSRVLHRMRDKGLITPTSENGRKYVVCFFGVSPASRALLKVLVREEFVSLD